ncbi:MAG TPA: hypothetical protein VGU74_10795 [Gemmatimonadales bacterium]|nr:hypothetical protein [Gemmatimonadales bacterium]
MKRYPIVFALLAAGGGAPALAAQRITTPAYAARERTTVAMAPTHDTFRGALVHYGKWFTAAGAAYLTYLASQEHQQSRREWTSLIAICRSARDACAIGSNGTYVRGDAEALYQLSRNHDRRANQWLFAAQATLFATTALFIIDLHPGGPDNIPYPSEIRVGALPRGTGVEMRLAF